MLCAEQMKAKPINYHDNNTKINYVLKILYTNGFIVIRGGIYETWYKTSWNNCQDRDRSAQMYLEVLM